MSFQPYLDDAEYAPYLEKDYCSNFTCCGMRLADLHELVGHFEESHVAVVPHNYSRAYLAQPDPMNDFPSPQTDWTPPESPSPSAPSTPPPNLFPTLTSAFQPREPAHAPIAQSPSRRPEAAAHGHRHDSHRLQTEEEQNFFYSMLRSDVSESSARPSSQNPHFHNRGHPPIREDSRTPICDPQTVALQLATKSDRIHHPPTLSPTPVYAHQPAPPILAETPRQGQSRARARVSEEILPIRRRKSSTQKQPLREKAFKCPHAGCIKSYANQNGLKYHLTKGSCDYAHAR